ncbi:uncharacterized protein [Rutidosis leptorrhynchoides]|uniref:uncharacterized protein n=1 Tax=Rutidosis leptorrhynchoides TaxID=125765 RepID=UPI003A99E5E0
MYDAQGRLDIDFDFTWNTVNPIGPNSSMFVSLISSVVRSPKFPKHYECWADVPRSSKELVWIDIRNFFKIEPWLESDKEHLVRAAVNKIAGDRWKHIKSEQQGYFKNIRSQYPNDIDFVRSHLPPDVEAELWNPFVDLMLNEEYQKRCEQNAKNRSKVQYHSLHGSKSIVKHLNENKIRHGPKIGPIKNYKLLHKPKDGTGWTKDFKPKQHYTRMKELLKEQPRRDETEVTKVGK